jgi:hypothetical protein
VGPTAAVCRQGGNRARVVCLVTAVVFLAFVPSVRADPDAAHGNAQADAASPAGTGDDQGRQPDGAGSSAAAPGHAADRPGSSENAPGHDPDGPGNSESAPGHQADQGTAIEQDAGASASADQGDVGNTHVTVRVDEPGNGTPVAQENRAEAQADAATSATADTPGEATIAQDVHADSSATQSDVGNTAVSVRVGSPGDDGAVSQTNVASAGATASGDDPGAQAAANASATQDGVANTSVSVRVFSPGVDGPVTQLNEATAAADAAADGAAEANATQDGVRNTSVSIRVESPGASAPVSQGNEATAAADDGFADAVAVAVTNDAVDTALAVVVEGDDLDRPGVAGLEIWVWDWTWQRDESGSLDALLGTPVGSWAWMWDGSAADGSGHGTVTSRAAGADDGGLVGGSWQWSWQWDRAGIAGWAWQWSWNESLACTTCIWIWNWSWSWTGQPTASTSDAAVTPGPPMAGQVNTARAEAEATTVAHADQTASQGGVGNGTQYVGQLIEISQTAEADASAVQSDVESVSWGDSAGQANVVTSEAAATLAAAVAQDVDQVVLSSDLATADQWSGQQADVTQSGRAEATTSQRDAVLTRSGEHAASGKAHSSGSADVDQLAAQAGLVDGGSLSQSIAQLTIIEQSSDAFATVGQGGTTRSKVRGGVATASGSAGDLALVDQAAQQTAVRDGGMGIQDSAQLAYIAQDAAAHATTAQLAGAAALPLASSDAQAFNRAWVAQAASQASLGSAEYDLQEILQQSIVVQSARAVSTSNGGIAGSAVVMNCAVTEQGATQSLGAGEMTGAGADLTTFCFPPATGTPSPMSLPLLSGRPETLAAGAPAGIVGAAPEEEPTLFHGRGHAATTAQADPATRGSASAPHHEAPVSGQPVAKTSVPHSTPARLDTRPGSTARDGNAGTEPPLPPAGGPLAWASALVAAASGAGPSGIAAILLAFALVAPLLLRAREGSVVRRPTDVLAPVDVPV